MSAAFDESSAFTNSPGVEGFTDFTQRMLERHKRIIDANVDFIRGRSVLDLASHNGRWSFAALQAGASFVMGVEGRQELINLGRAEFERFDPSRYRFVRGDIFDLPQILEREGRKNFDTVFCLGIYYHITDHYRLFRLMRSVNPTTIILDTPFLKTDEPVVRFKVEDPRDPSMGIREGSPDESMAGTASLGFLHLAARLSGYDVAFIPWEASDTQYPKPVEEYLDDTKKRRRYTVRLTARPDKPEW